MESVERDCTNDLCQMRRAQLAAQVDELRLTLAWASDLRLALDKALDAIVNLSER